MRRRDFHRQKSLNPARCQPMTVSVACLPIFFTGHSISRWEGMVFIGYYVALAAQQHDALPAFSAVMEWFVLPLTVITLGVVTWRAVRRPAGA
jgi:cation:H+ antiporter